MIGNFQDFTDNAQLRILSVLSVAAAVLCILSFLGIIVEIAFVFMKSLKTPVIFSILLFIITLIIGAGLIGFATIVRRIAVGI